LYSCTAECALQEYAPKPSQVLGFSFDIFSEILKLHHSG
jgi:hypothetical protein